MNNMKFSAMLILVLLAAKPISAQQSNLDSLWAVWSDTGQPDTLRLQAIYNFTWDGYLSPTNRILHFTSVNCNTIWQKVKD